MKAIAIPVNELYDIHIKFAEEDDNSVTAPVVHATVKTPVINGKRIATGALLSIFMPHTGGKANFSVMGQRTNPSNGYPVYFGFLIQE